MSAKTEMCALITGANRGLGRACAEMLLERGKRVILTARDMAMLDATRIELAEGFDEKRIAAYPCDVTRQDSIDALMADLKESDVQLDLLINNAGVTMSSDGLLEAEDSELQETFDINLWGPLRMTRACAAMLGRDEAGMVINVSSGMGAHEAGAQGYLGYRLSKCALNGLTTYSHHELSAQGIVVVCVCPGWVHTEMGGPSAPRTPREGAESILAPYFKDLPGGMFYRDGQQIPW